MLKKGDKAPDFKLPSDEGVDVSLNDYKGKQVVLYFYPKDNTSGCTTEALEFSALNDKFKSSGAVILGVSPDSIESHIKFKQKHSLLITLLSDPDHKVAESYNAYGEKSMYGRKYMGIIRSTFLISGDGTVEEVYYKVKPRGHAEEILCRLKN